MRLLFSIVLVTCVGLALAGCYPIGFKIGSGRLETREMDLAGFTGVNASHAFAVTITQDENYRVTVTADDNLWENLDVRVQGNTLHLGLRPGSYNSSTLRAEVTMPSLDAVDVSGAASATLRGFADGGNFSGQASGASRIEGDLEAADVDLDLSGASRINLRGSGDALRVDASGASNAELRDFAVETAGVNLSGASRADINPSGSLDYSLSGASNLTYSGNVKVGRSETSGGSSARTR
jgi:hypothetical protein